MTTINCNKTKRWAKATLTLGFIIASATMRAQSPTWTNITPPGWSGDFRLVEWFKDNGLLAVASNGYYYHSSDTGRTWVLLQAAPISSTTGLTVDPDRRRAFVYGNSGETGEIYTTSDGANTWQKLNFTGMNVEKVTGIYIKSEDTLLASANDGVNGMKIFLSADRGYTWTKVAENLYNTFFYGISGFCFVNSSHGYALAFGYYAETTDGGLSWTKYDTEQNIAYPNILEVKGHDAIVSVSNPSKATLPNLSGVSLYEGGITKMVLAGTKVYGVYVHNFFTSSDTGKTWSIKQLEDDKTFNSLTFIDQNTGVAVANELTTYLTTDGGTTWTKHVHGAAEGLNKVYCKTENECYMTGNEGRLFHTTDAGATWDYRDLHTKELQKVLFTTSDTGYVSASGCIFRTTDGGSTWSKYYHGTGGSVLCFPTTTTGYIGFSSGTLDKTTDAGQTWSLAADITYVENVGYGGSDATFKSESEGLAGTTSNKLLHTVDGGVSWEVKNLSNPNASARNILPVNNSWVVLSVLDSVINDTMYRFSEVYTCDVDVSCKKIRGFEGESGLLSRISDSLICFVNGDSIYYSSDVGNSWRAYEYGGGFGLCFASPRVAYSIGRYNVLKSHLLSNLKITSFVYADNAITLSVFTNNSAIVSSTIEIVDETNAIHYSIDYEIRNGTKFTIPLNDDIVPGVYRVKIIPVDTLSYSPVVSEYFTVVDTAGAEQLSASFVLVSGTNVEVTVASTGFSGTCALLLSDAAGSFASATVVDTALLATGVATSVALPAGIAAGTGYKLRIVPLDSLHYLPCTSQAFAIATSAAGEPVVGDQPRVKVVGGRVLCGCADAEVFSSLGVRVPAGAVLSPGVYLARCGGRVTEVVVR